MASVTKSSAGEQRDMSRGGGEGGGGGSIYRGEGASSISAEVTGE